MNRLTLNLSRIALVGLLVGQWLVTPAQAAGGLGIIPKQLPDQPSRSWFVYTLKPGSVQEDTVVVNNHSEFPMTVGVEAFDAANTTDGTFTLVTDSSKTEDLGTWVKPATDTVQLGPGKSAEVKFTITVPDNANVGQHSGAIAIYQKAANGSGGVGLKIVVGARIYVTIPGQVQRKVTFDSVTHEIKDGKLTFKITTTNRSNINLEPAIDMTMRGLFRTYHQEEDQNGFYLPGKTVTLTKDWKYRAPWMGYYRMNFVLHTWSVDQVEADGTVTSLPDLTFRYSYGFWVGGIYLAILGILIALGWLTFRFIIWRRDLTKFQTKIDIHTVQRGETIMHISEKTGVLPQFIVKFNRLVWPYSLNVGDRLMLPSRMLTYDELVAKRQRETMPSILVYLFASVRLSLYHPKLPSQPAASTAKPAAKPVKRRR